MALHARRPPKRAVRPPGSGEVMTQTLNPDHCREVSGWLSTKNRRSVIPARRGDNETPPHSALRAARGGVRTPPRPDPAMCPDSRSRPLRPGGQHGGQALAFHGGRLLDFADVQKLFQHTQNDAPAFLNVLELPTA